MQTKPLVGFDSEDPLLPTLHPVQSAWKLGRHLIRRLGDYMLYTVVAPRRFSLLRFDNQWFPVRVLLRELLSDLYTCLYRMEKRIQTLPHSYRGTGLTVFELGQAGDPQLCKRTLGYMRDTESFQWEHPEATAFDVDAHYQGWEQGEKYGLGSLAFGTGGSSESASAELTTV
jgi:hypothetical protein